MRAHSGAEFMFSALTVLTCEKHYPYHEARMHAKENASKNKYHILYISKLEVGLMSDFMAPYMIITGKGREKTYQILLDVKRRFIDSRSDPRMGQTEWFDRVIRGNAEDGSAVEVRIVLPKKTGFKDLVEKFVEAI